jgi:RNA polymerase sigma-70 factor (ECF subfamily)
MATDDLQETIASARRGDGKALAALLETYGPRLYGYFVRATGRHHDAEDLLGELTLRLVRQIERYDERGRFDQWLFRIAANLVRDRIRRRKSAPGVLSLSSAAEDDRPLEMDLPDDSAPVDGPALAAAASLELQEALETLDATTREMILLRHFGGMSFKELAELYQCPMGTALAKVHRGLRALRKRMGDDAAE